MHSYTMDVLHETRSTFDDSINHRVSMDLSHDDLSLGSIEEGRFSDYDDEDGMRGNTSRNFSSVENGASPREGDEELVPLVGKETRQVMVLKVAVLVVLTVTAIGLALTAFWILRKEENDDFEQQFEDFSEKIVEGFYRSANIKLWTANTLSVAYTSFVVRTGATAPNVSLPDWKVRSTGALKLAGATSVHFSPILLNDAALDMWIAYANETKANQPTWGRPGGSGGSGNSTGWEGTNSTGSTSYGYDGNSVVTVTSNEYVQDGAIEAGLSATVSESPTKAPTESTQDDSGGGFFYGKHDVFGNRQLQRGNDSPRPTTGRELSDGLWKLVNTTPVDDDSAAPYVPIWQMEPSLDGALFYNQMSEEARSKTLKKALEIGGAQWSNIFCFDELETNFYQYTKMKLGIGPSPDSVDRSPSGILYYPVVNSFWNRTRIGLIAIEFEWNNFFEDSFPRQFVGMQIVVESSCGDLHTFEIVDRGTTEQDDSNKRVKLNFLGAGDRHDPAFGHHGKKSTFTNFHKLCHFGRDFWVDTYSPGGTAPTLPQALLDADEEEDETISNHTCHYRIHIYPTSTFKNQYVTNEPMWFALGVGAIFLFAILIFVVYDWLVERRQGIVLDTANKTRAVVNQLFPKAVRDRMFEEELPEEQGLNMKRDTWRVSTVHPAKGTQQAKRRTFINPLSELSKGQKAPPPATDDESSTSHEHNARTAPIADLFPNSTIMFADIAGFTAWSSEREPSQVFTLLETLYRAFDKIAHKLGVFKVETIGDCYLACCGLFPPTDDHASIMARFAYECIKEMGDLTKKLEVTLGPGTCDLALRVGLHSGPVTAGVLRGEKSRFQLFGDTVNTAARMESNGKPNAIQASEATASLLTKANKQHWLTPRIDLVNAKGKGNMQTYWIRPIRRTSSSASGTVISDSSSWIGSRTVKQQKRSSMDTVGTSTQWGELNLEEAIEIRDSNKSGREDRIIDWIVDVLMGNLEKVVGTRQDMETTKRRRHRRSSHRRRRSSSDSVASILEPRHSPMEEVTEIIYLRKFDKELAKNRTPDGGALGPEVRGQVRDYVTAIASRYRDNHFHNLEHASHVTMSANKLMNRIITPDDLDFDLETRRAKGQSAEIHNSTFGISSDPLAQLAIVFSALIHDVEHSGLPNKQLIQQKSEVAVKYENKSPAEQNSVDVAWDLLMEPEYHLLRGAIYSSDEERKSFRQLVVNCVMATDIMDAELKTLRQNRWDRAFHSTNSQFTCLLSPLPALSSSSTSTSDTPTKAVSDCSTSASSESEDMNRKATIVIEHIIQASDVAHTMQHWHIYIKWNERLFQEMYKAYLEGNSATDPSIGWYEAELGFFDGYVIPLAKKLKECGVFGVASDEYLAYALENRREWEMKGREEAEGMLLRASIALGFPSMSDEHEDSMAFMGSCPALGDCDDVAEPDTDGASDANQGDSSSRDGDHTWR